jgi:glyoxylase-like metal-dependent hydrolase (beta-lactamase superfamily II)
VETGGERARLARMDWDIDDRGILIRRTRVGQLENNSYVVACKATGEAVLVDASFEADSLFARAADVHLRAILSTHGHWDHVSAAMDLKRKLDIPFRLHAADQRGDICELPVDQNLVDGEKIQVGEIEIRVVLTPGHTPGSVCFLVGDHAITGDTLFPGGPGRTDFDYGDFDAVIEAIRTRLFSLDGAVGVYPGHGDTMTTIGTERPHLEEWAARGW